MANSITIRQGNKVDLPILASGEPAFVVDEQEVFIGTGSSNIRILTVDDLYTDSNVDSHLSGGTGIDYSSGVISIDSTVATQIWVSNNFNNYVHPSHTGDVTGSSELTIGEDKVKNTMIDWGTDTGQVNSSHIPIIDTSGYYSNTNVETVIQEIGQELSVHNLSGFEDRTKIALSYSGTPPTITLTFTGTVYWWSDGVRYSNSGTDDVIISDVNGLHVIYYDGDTLTAVANPTHTQTDTVIENKAVVAYLYWNTNNNTVPYIANELHGCQMSGVTHHYLHDTVGLAYEEGGTISEYTLNVASDAAISFDLTNLEAYDEDIRVEVTNGTATNQYEQVLVGDAEIPVLYRDGIDQSWTEQAASTLPYLVGGNTRIQYMDKDNNYTLTEVENGKFCSYWLVFTNDWQYPVKMIPGNQQYDNQNEVENNAQAELLDLSDLATQETTILYQFIMQDSSGGTTNALITNIIDYRGSSLKGNSIASATDHGSLSGLTDDDHPQYILGSNFTQNGGILVGTGSGTYQEETGATLRTSIGVDPAGTDNSTDVTLAGSYDYLTISGQEITLSQIDLTTDVTGNLPTSSVENLSGTNTGDQTNLSGISDTKANFNIALSDGSFAFDGGAFHDGFSDFVSNEHIDHSSVSISAGTGLSGGGDLTTTRSLSVDYGTSAGTACEGNDSRLSDSREWTAETVSQSEAETGTATTRRAWTAQRVKQAIDVLAGDFKSDGSVAMTDDLDFDGNEAKSMALENVADATAEAALTPSIGTIIWRTDIKMPRICISNS